MSADTRDFDITFLRWKCVICANVHVSAKKLLQVLETKFIHICQLCLSCYSKKM